MLVEPSCRQRRILELFWRLPLDQVLERSCSRNRALAVQLLWGVINSVGSGLRLSVCLVLSFLPRDS